MRRGEVWETKSRSADQPLVLIVQADEFNDSAIPTVICAGITQDSRLAAAPGNVRLGRRVSGIDGECIVDVAQLVTLRKEQLRQPLARLSSRVMRDVDAGLRLVLALSIGYPMK